MSRKIQVVLLLLVLPLLAAGRCEDDALTAKEAFQTVEEVSLSSRAVTLTSSSIEITTNFTIGQAVEQAAQEVKDFVESQLPCAEITLDGATLNIEYGANPGDCTYKGNTFSGSHSITVSSAQAGNVVVDHEWQDFSNGSMTVSGTAQVTWSSAESSRNVVHELTWEREWDGWTVVGGGERTQTVLSGGLLEGIQIDGGRYWNSDRGDWDLSINGVQVRWVDPVPQSGSYDIQTPFDKSATLTFERVDEDTIKVIVESGSESFDFDVTKSGTVSE